MPTEVEQLPTGGGGGEIALLVEPPGVGAEVESPTVGLDTEPYGRDREVDPCHESAIAIEDPILGHDRWDRRIGETFGDEFLEPRLRDAALVGDGVEESEQLAGPGLAGSVTPLGGLTDPLDAGPASASIGECTADLDGRAHRSEVGKGPGQPSGGDASDVDDVEVGLQAVDMVNRCAEIGGESESVTVVDRHLDMGVTVETVESVEPGRRPV
jgi:hypothetical protein